MGQSRRKNSTEPAWQSSFDADAAFLAFIGASEQKSMEAEILNTLIGDLASEGNVLEGDGSIRLFVPGIGEGAQAAELAAGIVGSTGRKVYVHGTDVSEALSSVAMDRLAADPNVESVEIQLGDAFNPGDVSVAGMDLAIASHLLYYPPSEAADVALVTALVKGLGVGGVALFLHEPPAPSSIAALREKYARGNAIPSPVALVEQAADGLGVPVHRVEYRSTLRFPRVGLATVLDALDSPGSAAADEARRLIEFVLQRGLRELRQDGTLDEALDDFFARLDPETNELEWQVQLQVLPSKDLAADLAGLSSLESSVERTRSEIPEIERRHLRR